MSFCDCEEGSNLAIHYPTLFKKDPSYGWVLCWMELTTDAGHTTKHNYGLCINYCPMCGKKLKTED